MTAWMLQLVSRPFARDDWAKDRDMRQFALSLGGLFDRMSALPVVTALSSDCGSRVIHPKCRPTHPLKLNLTGNL